MRFDLQAYQRKLKITAFFLLNKHNLENIPFTPKSGWTPTAGQTTETIHQIIQRDWTYFNHKLEIDKIQSNLTRAEIKALRLLAQNKRIVINPADKGNALEILDRCQYLWEGNRQLSDPNYYRPLNQPIYSETLQMILSILNTVHQKKKSSQLNKKLNWWVNGNPDPDASVCSKKSTRTPKDGANLSKSPREDP